MPSRLLHAVPWIKGILQMALGVGLAATTVGVGYLWLNDPIKIENMRGEMIGAATVRIAVTGEKFHDRCPGHWALILNGNDHPSFISAEVPTGFLPVGRMIAVPVDIDMPHNVLPGTYTATAIMQYDCAISFRHRASFVLVVP